MYYLQEAFNKTFVQEKINTVTGEIYYKHDGQKFENIIKKLLEEMFPEIVWNPTEVTNDGNKDFWASKFGEILWAECKNYATPLEMKTVSPTLVMAQLCNADEIYFFSVSPINSNAKKKICYYSQINQKRIHFICDEVLESLLLRFDKTRACFSHLKNLPAVSKASLSPEQYTLIMKNPFLNIITDDQIIGKPLEKIELNEIISEQIFVINNSTTDNLEFTIKIDTHNDNLYCFEYLEECVPSSIGNIDEEFSIKPYEVFTKIYNFRVVVYQPELQIPTLTITYHNAENGFEPAPKQCVRCENIGRINLIGAEYEDIIKMVTPKITHMKRLLVFWCKGKSGVGKTRILEEITALFMKSHYKVLNFMGIEQENSFSIIKEIIYVLYNITEDMIEKIVLSYQETHRQNTLPSNTVGGLELLRALYENKNSIKSFLEKFGELIYEKLSRNKYAIMLDNLQYFDDGMIAFMNGLIMYSKNTNRQNSIALCLTINEDYLSDNLPAQKMIGLLEKLQDNSFVDACSVNLSGFSPDSDSGLLYIKQFLKIREETFDEYLKNLVKNANYNPYNIKYYAEYINSKKTVSSVHNGQRIIHNPVAFIKIIDDIPSELETTLNERWMKMCRSSADGNIEKSKNKFLYILSCLHIFRYLSYEDFLKLGCIKKYINHLKNYHFIKMVSSGSSYKYVFDHDLIENFFEKIDSQNLFCGVKYLKNKNLADFEIDYPYAFHYINLNKNSDINDLLESIEYGISNELPYRLFLRYQQLSLKNIIKNWDIINNPEKCISYARKVCTAVRERLGGGHAHDLYVKIKNKLDKYSAKEIVKINNFPDMLFDICENYHHLGKYKEVTKIYGKYLEEFERIYKENKAENYLNIIAFIYNRLAIAYKHFPDPKSQNLRDAYIESALNYSKKLKNRQYYAESLYDKAEFYYNYKENKEMFVDFCNLSCCEVDNNNIELMYLHNIQRKIRLGFVEQKREEIPGLIQEGLNYIENGEYTDYRFFFSKFLHTAQAMFYLLEGKNFKKALQETYLSIQDTLSFGTNEISYNQFLQGKIYFMLKEYSKAFEAYKEAYLSVQKSRLIEKDFILELISDDIKLKVHYFSNEDFTFLSENDYECVCRLMEMSEQEYNAYQNDYHAKSIICSDDGKENYPSI